MSIAQSVARNFGRTLLLPLKTYFRPLASNMSNKPEEVIQYWFGPNHVPWFGGQEKVNQEIREKYGGLVEQAFEGKLDSWKAQPRSSLALILICDQFCRNVNKGTGKMNGLDPVALELSQKFIEQKTHNHLDFGFFERLFIYLPFEHSESRENHVLNMQLFQKLLEDAKTPEEKKAAEGFLLYAEKHKEVIDRFGRYPQRNAMLERADTPEEKEFLANLPPEYKW